MFRKTNLSLYSDERQEKMPRTKIALAGLTIVCITLLILTSMLKGSLCEFELHGGSVLSLAFSLAYESR